MHHIYMYIQGTTNMAQAKIARASLVEPKLAQGGTVRAKPADLCKSTSTSCRMSLLSEGGSCR